MMFDNRRYSTSQIVALKISLALAVIADIGLLIEMVQAAMEVI